MSKTLNLLKTGEKAKVLSVDLNDNMRRRLNALGLVEGTDIECVQISPLGDPAAYSFRGAVIALRSEDAQGVLIWQ